MLRIIEVEARLFVRDRLNSLFSLLFPSLLLLVLGAVPALRTPAPEFGGLRFTASYMSSLVVLTLVFIGLQRWPATTPIHRARLLWSAVLAVGGAACTVVVPDRRTSKSAGLPPGWRDVRSVERV
jgi:hypothetical protein